MAICLDIGPSKITSQKSSISTFLSVPYRTVIHHSFQAIGHSAASNTRHVVVSMTHRSRSLPESPAHHESTETQTIKSLGQLHRHHPPSPSNRHTKAGIGWGGMGILGIGRSELEELKHKRHREQALAKRIKQSRRGEIDTWDVDAGSSTTYWSDAAPGMEPSMNDSTPPKGLWSCWDSASTPVSDEEWGEDWDYGSNAPDFSELMAADPTLEQYCWDQQSSEVMTTMTDRIECDESPVPPLNTGTDSMAADTTFNETSMVEAGASPMPTSLSSPVPLSSKQIMLTPISPALSPKVPSGLNVLRKRQRPNAAETDEVQETLPKEHDGQFRDNGFTSHMNKKPFARSC